MKSLACGLTTSLTVETDTVRGDGVEGGERGAAVEAGAGVCDADGGAGGAAELNVEVSMRLEGEQDTPSVFRLVGLSKAGTSNKTNEIFSSDIY